jgi:hypothetical protein
MAAQVQADVAPFSRRDISDLVTVADMKSCPLYTALPKGSQNEANMLMEWPVDKNLEPTHAATADATDVTEFENALADYQQLRNYQQWYRPKGWAVGKIAQIGQNMPGIKNKKAKAVAKKMVQLKRMLEASVGSDLSAAEWTGAVGGVSRGIGDYISATAQSVLPVPTAYLTRSGCIDTTASASLTETIIQNVLQARYEVAGEKKTLSNFCGPNHKKAYRSFTQGVSASTNSATTVRMFTQTAESRAIVNTIDTYVGDFGTLELIEDLWLAYYNSTTPTTTAANDATQLAISKARAYALDLERWDWVGSQAPQSQEFPDLGGGPRGSVDAIGGLRCLNPICEIKFAPTS